jgi:hypothetical protein
VNGRFPFSLPLLSSSPLVERAGIRVVSYNYRIKGSIRAGRRHFEGREKAARWLLSP